jgi:hypothetical protein
MLLVLLKLTLKQEQRPIKYRNLIPDGCYLDVIALSSFGGAELDGLIDGIETIHVEAGLPGFVVIVMANPSQPLKMAWRRSTGIKGESNGRKCRWTYPS